MKPWARVAECCFCWELIAELIDQVFELTILSQGNI